MRQCRGAVLEDPLPNPPRPVIPVRAFLTGEGGTGKSRVARAIIEFARRWFIPECVAVISLAGVAAQLLEGVLPSSTYGCTTLSCL